MPTRPPYEKGLHELGEHTWAWLQPDGSWGYSNAGLVCDGGQSLLVDTLFDLELTRQMLEQVKRITGGRAIDTLVNTHANGDHCWGNQLVEGAEIVASRQCAAEMRQVDPSLLALLLRSEDTGPVTRYLQRIFAGFDFEGITLTPPTRTFEGELELRVGARQVRLMQVGPAHTSGDVMVYVPDERTLFTGDIIFIDSTPLVWAGPISNWIRACDRILQMEVELVVPGHGPLTDKAGVQQVRDYLCFVELEASERFRAGMSVEEAARDIALGRFAGWKNRERIAANVQARYRELRGDSEPADTIELFGLMERLAR
jgi:cyclase